MAIDAVEVAELGDDAAGRIDDDDLVGLVRRDPQIVARVDDEAVGAVDRVHEHFGRARRAGRSVRQRNAHDRVVARIGDEQRRCVAIEREAVGAERRNAGRAEHGSVTQAAGTPPLGDVRQIVAWNESEM